MRSNGVAFRTDIVNPLYHEFLMDAQERRYHFSLILRDDTAYDNHVNALLSRCDAESQAVHRVIEWPGTKLLHGAATQISAPLSQSSAMTLASAGNLFRWKGPDFPDDLIIADGDRPVLYATSHERVGWIAPMAFSCHLIRQLAELIEHAEGHADTARALMA